MLAIIVISSAVAIFYAYFGYPLLLMLASLFRSKESKTYEAQDFSLAIVIAAHNEASVIQVKIENTIAALDKAGLSSAKIIVASDASNDGMDERVASCSDKRVSLVAVSERKGKEYAQQVAVSNLESEIIVFTDAKVRLAEDAIEKFLPYFYDPSVGAVSSWDMIEGASEEGSGEGFYVQYEMWLRKLEAAFGSIVGLSGSCFAVRRELSDDLSTDIPSDFSLLLAAKKRGLKGVQALDVLAYYKAVKTEEAEFSRKVRTVLRGISTLFARSSYLNPFRYGLFSLQLISHKLFRWLVPIFFLIVTVGSVFICDCGNIFTLISIACFSLLFVALLAFMVKSLRSILLFKIPLYFVVVNSAIFVAWLRYLSGNRKITWTPTSRS